MEKENANKFELFMQQIESAAKAVLLITIGVLIIWNFNKLSALLNNITHVKFSEIELQISPVSGKDSKLLIDKKFIGRNNMTPRASIIDYHPKQPEYIEIRALDTIDLTSGYVGDASELYSINKNSTFLNPGECVRIYVSAKDIPISEIKRGDKCLKVPISSTEAKKTYLKSKIGKGDRFVLFDAQRNPVIDINYWVVESYN